MTARSGLDDAAGGAGAVSSPRRGSVVSISGKVDVLGAEQQERERAGPRGAPQVPLAAVAAAKRMAQTGAAAMRARFEARRAAAQQQLLAAASLTGTRVSAVDNIGDTMTNYYSVGAGGGALGQEQMGRGRWGQGMHA